MTIKAALSKLLNLNSETEIRSFMTYARSDDTDLALGFLRQAARTTRREMAAFLSGSFEGEISDETFSVLVKEALALQVGGKWKGVCLFKSLHRGDAELAKMLLTAGADPDEFDNSNSVLGHLAHGTFTKIESQDALDLMKQMIQVGGDIFNASAGVTHDPDMLSLLLKHWPDPQKEAVWKENGYVWDLKDAITAQASFNKEASRSMAILLQAGFSFDPLEALEKSIDYGNKDAGAFVIHHCTDEMLGGWRKDNGGNLWHVVAAAWGLSERRKEPGDDEFWPDEEVIRRLVVAVDAKEVSDYNETPAEIAISLCGSAGPMLMIEAEQEAHKISLETVSGAAKRSKMGRRL